MRKIFLFLEAMIKLIPYSIFVDIKITSMKPIAITKRLKIRKFVLADAKFIVKLVNQPDWIKHIGERNIRTQADAIKYLKFGPLAMYENHGFGLFGVERLSDGELLGMCGLLKRDVLDDMDIGFAFLAEYYGHGYAIEAAQAVINFAKNVLKVSRLAAVVNPDNTRSIKLLIKAGFVHQYQMRLTPDAVSPVNLMLFEF